MKMIEHVKIKQQRKLLLVFPLLVIPFLTLFFWAMGGGKGRGTLVTDHPAGGFNKNLPVPVLKARPKLGKLGYYKMAASDSLDRGKHFRPGFPLGSAGKSPANSQLWSADNPAEAGHLQAGRSQLNDPDGQEAMVYRRLAELQALSSQPASHKIPPDARPSRSEEHAMRPPAQPEDPELKQMNSMLEKILDIQHPERMNGRKAASSQAADTAKFKAIPAAIDGKQRVTQGSVVRMKLLDSVRIKGMLIPRGQLIFATGTLVNQRLLLTITSLRVGYTILPVDFTVFDMADGLEGISVPEATTAESVKEGSDNALQAIGLVSMDQSITSQATAAGINAAKGLFSKKIKRVKATLKDKHQLLLRNNTTQR